MEAREMEKQSWQVYLRMSADLLYDYFKFLKDA